MVAGPRFGDYHTGFRFGRLGHDLVEQHGLTRFQARTYMSFGSFVLPWTRHVRAGRDFLHRALQAANKMATSIARPTGGGHLATNLLAAGTRSLMCSAKPRMRSRLRRKRGSGLSLTSLPVSSG